MGGASGRQYVALLIDPTTGEIEAYGPAAEPDAVVLAAELQTRTVVDARNLLDPAAMRRLGFAYHGVGR